MPDYLPIPRFPLPDDLEPDGTWCVKIRIPADQQYLGVLIGLVDMLKWSRNFARDASGTGAAVVSRTWQQAIESEPIEVEGCDMPEFRINPETCLLEVDCDGDWVVIKTPLVDPRTDIPYPPPYPDPPPAGQTNECLAAANIAEWVWITGYNFASQLDSGGLFAEFIALVMSVITGFFTLAIDVILDSTNTLFSQIDPDTILADWSAIDKPDFINLIVCYLEPDGSFPSDKWGDFLTELTTRGATNQGWYLIHYIMLLMGWGGINLIGRIGGITEADCDACGWEQCDDMTISMHGWDIMAFPPDDPFDPDTVLGSWVSGSGVKVGYSVASTVWRLLVGQSFVDTVINTVKVFVNVDNAENRVEVYRALDGVLTYVGGVDDFPVGAGDYTFDLGGELCDEIRIYLRSDGEESFITEICTTGEGENPLGA